MDYVKQRKEARGKVWGERVDRHCPFDESQLRVSLMQPGYYCTVCWTHFQPEPPNA